MKILTVLLTAFIIYTPLSSQWKPAEAPLMSPWASHVDPENVLQEHPRPQMVRDTWINLNGLWQFQEAKTGEPVPYNKKLSEQILVPFPWESALSGLRKQIESQRAWYRHSFAVPIKWLDNRTLLHFGAVDWETKVYVNKRCVGTHKGGYDAFTYDITEYLNPKGTNELIVEVYDPGNDRAIAFGKQNNDRFDNPQRYAYTPSSGIWQTVWLENVPQSYIADLKIETDIDRGQVKVNALPAYYGENLKTQVKVFDKGQLIASDTGRIKDQIAVGIPNPKLWSPSSPYLYDMEVTLYKNGQVADKVKSYFGMRKIALAKSPEGLQMIHLNNKHLFQMGTLDQGYWPDGIYTAPTDEALKWDIEKTKEWGFNMIRKHIKVEPARWYYWCDKLGILVWQDMPNTFKPRTPQEKIQFESELQQMVKTHWNHPSIIIWVVFNEHWGIYDCERITQNIVDLDPTRLVTGNSGIDAGKPNIDFEVGHIIDNHSYRPPNVPFATQKRASVCGEYGAIGYKIDGHIWDTDGPWVHHNYADKEAATAEYEKFIGQIIKFQSDGLNAAVYTQWTDVENEMNGIFTYDRKVEKHFKDRIVKANKSTYVK